MKALTCSLTVFLLVSLTTIPEFLSANAQDPPDGKMSAKECLSRLPADLQIPDADSLDYHVTSTIHVRGVGGDVRSKVQLAADLSRLTKGDEVRCRWNNVRVAAPSDPSGPFSEGVLLDYMEDFSYTLSERIMHEDFYQHIPEGDLKHLLKTLIWDAATLEPVFWDYFAALKLNEDHLAGRFDKVHLKMANWGTLRMRDLKITWIGVSKMNDEPCALLQYRSFANPVESSGMNIEGRSLYWGCIWVSLDDKQVEYLTLFEDVIMEMPVPSVPGKRITNLQREVTIERVP